MDISTGIKKLNDSEQLMSVFSHAMSVMHYDGATAAPEMSYIDRSKSLGLLSTYSYDILLNKENKENVRFLMDNRDLLSSSDKKRVELLQEKIDKIEGIPLEEYAEYRALISESEAVWKDSKAKNDFKSFMPYIDKIIDVKKKFAAYFDPDKHPYDFYLNEYERGSDRDFFDNFFETIKARLVPLISEISDCPAPDISFLQGNFPIYKQRRLSEVLMEFLNIDSSRCVLGETEHPFTAHLSRNDCRVTTHYYEDDFTSSFYSVIHECGHALYDMGIKEEYYNTVLGTGTSMGIHESQSRFYENIVGRSLPFCEYILPHLANLFPQFEKITPKEFYKAVNVAEPSLIRIRADELTYSMHILIRYELEKMLFENEISAVDLPELWNNKYREYLGIDVPNDSVGVLQDTHWGGGMFGYFPSYSLGSAYSAQIFHYLNKDLDFSALVSSGDIKPVYEWLRDRIYIFGSEKDPDEIIRICCNEEFNPNYYIDYLENKFRALYNI
ncbi:MAG: carboxypeptidase M32 [Ruminococcaceae bacterium]|nr:carboxypeptidase M32 [Oscillospiraceae bacterium]